MKTQKTFICYIGSMRLTSGHFVFAKYFTLSESVQT